MFLFWFFRTFVSGDTPSTIIKGWEGYGNSYVVGCRSTALNMERDRLNEVPWYSEVTTPLFESESCREFFTDCLPSHMYGVGGKGSYPIEPPYKDVVKSQRSVLVRGVSVTIDKTTCGT